MMKAVNKIVHENYSPTEAFEYFNTLKARS